MNDQELENRVRQTLDAGAPEPDELTRAALRAARYRALDQMEERRHSWWRMPLALASVLAVSVLSWQLSQPAEEDLQVAANTAEDAAVIADLDLVLWLEEGEV